jgi:hypothetical protein
MQHLLDFIHEHALEEQLYFVVECHAVELELLWQRSLNADHWRMRQMGCDATWESIPRAELLQILTQRGCDMAGVERELNAMLAAQIALADMVLRHANDALGRDVVQRFLRQHASFIEVLAEAVDRLTAQRKPSVTLLEGGGAQTTIRAGHLSVVR